MCLVSTLGHEKMGSFNLLTEILYYLKMSSIVPINGRVGLQWLRENLGTEKCT